MYERIKLRDELLDQLKSLSMIAKWKNIYTIHSMDTFFNKLKENTDLQSKYNTYIGEFRSDKEGLYCLLHISDITEHLCPVCGKNCEFYINEKRRRYIYRNTCGNNSCQQVLAHSEEANEKLRQTNMKRYNVPYAPQSKEVQEKMKETNRKKYNSNSPLGNVEIRAKIKKIMIERHNVDHPMRSDIIKAKARATFRKHFNADHPMKCEEVQEKQKETNRIRYGCDYSLLNENVKTKSKKTFMDNYGVESYSQIHIKHFDIWNDDDKFKKFIVDKYNEKGMFLVLTDISGFFNVHPYNVKRKLELLGLLDYFYIQDSNLEIQFKDFLDENNITYNRRNRNILQGNKDNTHKEIDFVFEDNKIGIEINDIGSHNIIGNDYYNHPKDKQYHLNKSIDAKNKGYHLIHLWEWELRNDDEWHKLSGWILNLLNNDKIKIGARKCIIKDVSLKEEKEFLNNYHLQGYKKSKICLGLYYNDELIQLMSFSDPRYNKNYQWELLRLCTKYGYYVIGGAKRLLDYFIKNYQPESIISYCNLDKFIGNVYTDIGFKLLRNVEPQIMWCNKDMKHFTNASLNWIGADKMIGTNYGKGTDNEEIVIKHGYVPIYNCGLAVYELKRKGV